MGEMSSKAYKFKTFFTQRDGYILTSRRFLIWFSLHFFICKMGLCAYFIKSVRMRLAQHILTHLSHPLIQWFSKCCRWTSNDTWELIRKANSRAHPRAIKPNTLGEGAQ